MAERQTVALRAELRRRLADEETEVRISGAAVEAVRAARLGAGRFSAGAPGAADVEAAEARYGSAVAARDGTRARLAGGWVVVPAPAGVGGLSSEDLAAYGEGRLAVEFEGDGGA